MMDKQTWVSRRAQHLWEHAGRPENRSEEFWYTAEKEYKDDHLCVMCLGSCPFQETQCLTGGRHIAICNLDEKKCSYMAKQFAYSKLDEMVLKMRDERRMKLNTDWAYTVKYGELHVLCHAVYKEAIIEYADAHGIKVASINTYGENS